MSALFNIANSVLLEKLEVIILITIINSGGTDSPAQKKIQLSRTALWTLKVTGFFLSDIALVRIYQKGWQFNCNLITGRNCKDLSPENVTSYCFSTKISVSLYQKGWQFSCHLITGSNV